ncbi:MAG: MFS transporter [Nanoarchaeota archaeon]
MLDKDFPIENEGQKKKKSLFYSILDGTFYSAMVGFGESFFSAFAVFLKATNFQLGLLGSVPQFLGSISQLLSEKFIHLFSSRKRFVALAAILEAVIYIPIALVFFFGHLSVPLLIIFVCIYWIFGMIASAAWSSWMGDLVDEKERGSYFGRRNKIAGLTSFVTYLIAGYLLQRFAGDTQYYGFVFIFALALLSRVMSFLYLTKKYEPYYVEAKETRMGFFEFVKQAQHNNFGIFVIFMTLMNFAVYLAAPYFAAYMLKDLRLDYMTFAFINGAAIIVKYLSMPVWGKMSDKYGTLKVLRLSAFLMPIVPILWVFGDSFWYLIIIQIYAGFAWAGLELSSFNFIFDTTRPSQRASFVSYYNVLNGVALLFGAIIGSVIIRYNHVFWSKFILVFLVSGIFRFLVTFLFVKRLKEVRTVESISYKDLFFKVITTIPSQGVVHDIVTFKIEEQNIETKDGKSKNYKLKIKFLEST